VPAEPRALRRDHRFRQERPASLGREPEPGMLGHEKSADRPALIISFDWSRLSIYPPLEDERALSSRDREKTLRRTAHEIPRKKKEHRDRYLV